MYFNYLMVLILVSAVFALDTDAGPNTEYGSINGGHSNTTITLTSVNNFALSGFSTPRGMDFSNTYYELYIADYGDDKIYVVDPSNGTAIDSLPCPTEIPNVAGVISAEYFGYHLFINDWDSVHDIWKYDDSWTFAFTNPVPLEPRGMDSDNDGNIWCQDASDRQLYMFDYGASNVTHWSMPDCPASYSMGIALFPFGSNQGIVLSGYSWTDLYFYEYDGANLAFLGSAPTPQTASSSYGLAYSDYTNAFFWVYRDGSSVYNICEFTAVIETALQRDTWGRIKAIF